MTTTLRWDPSRLNAAIQRAYVASLDTAREDAENHSPSSRAGVRLQGNSLVASDLGTVFERGRQGGYPIELKDNLAIRFPNGTFATRSVGGPMSPKPFIRPAAGRWANGGFQAVARRTLSMSGF